MRPLLLILLLAILFAGCDKDNDKCDPPTSGLWIEKSQRLDTLDFNTPSDMKMHDNPIVLLKARPFMDPAISTVYPRIYSSMYGYYYKEGKMYLHNAISAMYMNYIAYEYRLGSSCNSFKVKKFYGRASLPDEIEFVRLR